MAQAAVAGASAPVVVARKGAARTLGTNDPNEVPVNYDGTCEGDYDGPPPAVRLACDCAECAWVNHLLRQKRAIEELEKHAYPPRERLRRWMLWKQVTPFTVDLLVCWFEALEAAEFLVAAERAQLEFEAAAAQAAAEAEKAAQVPVSGEDEETSEIPVRVGPAQIGAVLQQDSLSQHRQESPCDDDPGIRQEQIFERLRTVGLNDREIALLARLCEGHSQRDAAELCGISKTHVCRLTSSALTKITQAGLTLHFPKHKGGKPMIFPVDPKVLDSRQLET
jgi:predicted DNA-binding protein (UPF0251 family)